MKTILRVPHPDYPTQARFSVEQSDTQSHVYFVFDHVTGRYTGPPNAHRLAAANRSSNPYFSTAEAAKDYIDAQIKILYPKKRPINTNPDTNPDTPTKPTRTTYRSGQPTITPISDAEPDTP